MRIRIEGPTIAEFDPQPGLNFWWSSGSRMRRPLFNDLSKTMLRHTVRFLLLIKHG